MLSLSWTGYILCLLGCSLGSHKCSPQVLTKVCTSLFVVLAHMLPEVVVTYALAPSRLWCVHIFLAAALAGDHVPFCGAYTELGAEWLENP